jgi:hypothetical protein
MTYPTPSPEQIKALASYASRNGRTWKSKLSEAWSNGRDEREPEAAELRSVRNRFGPTWLFDKFKLPKA